MSLIEPTGLVGLVRLSGSTYLNFVLTSLVGPTRLSGSINLNFGPTGLVGHTRLSRSNWSYNTEWADRPDF